jgi:hypothetical protein
VAVAVILGQVQAAVVTDRITPGLRVGAESVVHLPDGFGELIPQTEACRDRSPRLEFLPDDVGE